MVSPVADAALGYLLVEIGEIPPTCSDRTHRARRMSTDAEGGKKEWQILLYSLVDLIDASLNDHCGLVNFTHVSLPVSIVLFSFNHLNSPLLSNRRGKCSFIPQPSDGRDLSTKDFSHITAEAGGSSSIAFTFGLPMSTRNDTRADQLLKEKLTMPTVRGLPLGQ